MYFNSNWSRIQLYVCIILFKKKYCEHKFDQFDQTKKNDENVI